MPHSIQGDPFVLNSSKKKQQPPLHWFIKSLSRKKNVSDGCLQFQVQRGLPDSGQRIRNSCVVGYVFVYENGKKKYYSLMTVLKRVCECACDDACPPQGAFYGQNDQALIGMSKFFMKMAEVELEDARAFIDFQNERGGVMTFFRISNPNPDLSTPVGSFDSTKTMLRNQITRMEAMHVVAVTEQASEVSLHVKKIPSLTLFCSNYFLVWTFLKHEDAQENRRLQNGIGLLRSARPCHKDFRSQFQKWIGTVLL